MMISPEDAAELLSSGHVVALPTETVYGLAAAIAHPAAIQQIYALKGRPSNNPLIVHLSRAEQLSKYVSEFPPQTKELIERFWPGPLSIVFKAKGIPKEATGALTTAAFRIPNFAVTREVIERAGPLVMPSANLSGKPSGTSVQDLFEDFGDSLPVVDGGVRPGGIESTVIHFAEGKWKIIRLGAITAEELEQVLEYRPDVLQTTKDKPICPGQLYRHYAPTAKLHLVADFSNEQIPSRGVVLGFSDRTYPADLEIIDLGSTQEPGSVAENLYGLLRLCDRRDLKEVWIDFNLPVGGLWETLKERIVKAAVRE